MFCETKSMYLEREKITSSVVKVFTVFSNKRAYREKQNLVLHSSLFHGKLCDVFFSFAFLFS